MTNLTAHPGVATAASAEGLRMILRARLRYHHRGAARAVKAHVLMRVLGMRKRAFNAMILEMRLAGDPIGSAMAGDHPGLYWAASAEEIEDTVRPLKAAAARKFEVIRALEQTRDRLFGAQRKLF